MTIETLETLYKNNEKVVNIHPNTQKQAYVTTNNSDNLYTEKETWFRVERTLGPDPTLENPEGKTGILIEYWKFSPNNKENHLAEFYETN